MSKTTTGNARGARTKCTPENLKRICEAVARGLPLTYAARVAGIAYQTFSTWRNRDKNFRDQLELAIAAGCDARLKVIEQAANLGEWRAAAWMLEHCPGNAEHFSKTRLEVTGVNGSPLAAGQVLVYLPEKVVLAETNGHGVAEIITIAERSEIEKH